MSLKAKKNMTTKLTQYNMDVFSDAISETVKSNFLFLLSGLLINEAKIPRLSRGLWFFFYSIPPQKNEIQSDKPHG